MYELTLIFIALKIFGLIDWSWWAVTAPIWLVFVYFFIIGIFERNEFE